MFLNSPAVGLCAYRQTAPPTVDPALVACALRSYLLSDVPLILLLDLGLMGGGGWRPLSAGVSIYEANGILFKPDSGPPRPMRHGVVAVGCARDHRNPDFLINDPATGPFLKASLNQLLQACLYEESVKPATTSFSKQKLTAFQFISATPIEVTSPLLPVLQRPPSREDPARLLPPLRGLLDMARTVQTYRPRQSSLLELHPHNAFPGEFRLAYLGPGRSVRLQEIPSHVVDYLAGEVRAARITPGWYWVQYVAAADRHRETRASLWLWCADLDPDTPRRDWEHLGSLHGLTDQGWRPLPLPPRAAAVAALESHSNPPASPKEEDKRRGSLPDETQPAGKPVLRPALLSSYSTLGIAQVRKDRQLPLGPYRTLAEPQRGTSVAAEAYVFMEPDIHCFPRGKAWHTRLISWLLPCLRIREGRPPRTAVEFLAQLTSADLDVIANRLDGNFRASNTPIIGLASFIPEIAWPDGSEEGDQAAKAIASLLRLAQRLQRRGQPAHTVELVTGSLIQGIWGGRPRGQPANDDTADDPSADFYATVLDEGDAQRNVLTALRTAFRVAGLSRRSQRARRVNVALELEPGPFFLLNTWGRNRSSAPM